MIAPVSETSNNPNLLLRTVLLVAVTVAAAAFLILLAAGFAEAFIGVTGWLGFHHALGIDTQSSQNYDFVSGVGPMVIAALGFSGVGVTVLHHLNCHQTGCPRIGRFPVAGGQFKTCRQHHPDPAVREGIQAQHLKAAHEAYQNR